jgi:DsbC/DsbD-like thiol-disulfide interchange protein
MLDSVAARSLVALVMLACLAGATSLRAEEASPWQDEGHSAARLIAGGVAASDDTKWLPAGVEIRLQRGWKTYWRYPGDSGAPPTLDFTASSNVKAVKVLWPAPHRFADGAGGNSIGYVGDVLLPLKVIPRDPAKAATLRLKLSYAICADVCVPAEANLHLELLGTPGPQPPALAAAEERVPRHVPLGATARPGSAGLAVRSIYRDESTGGKRVIVEITAPQGAPVDVFVEGPTSDWALPLPTPLPARPGDAPELRRFAFPLDGLPPGAKPEGATLTITAESPTDAIEVSGRLD